MIYIVLNEITNKKDSEKDPYKRINKKKVADRVNFNPAGKLICYKMNKVLQQKCCNAAEYTNNKT